MKADVTDEADVARMVGAAMDRWGQVDVLMSNAAEPGKDKWIWEQTVENFIDTYKVDCMAAMLCSKRSAQPLDAGAQAGRDRDLLRRRGLERHGAQEPLFRRQGRADHAHQDHGQGSRAATASAPTAWCPARSTPSCCSQLPQAHRRRARRELSRRCAPRRRTACRSRPSRTPEDIAHMALFLASDQARTITGQAINVDAGLHDLTTRRTARPRGDPRHMAKCNQAGDSLRAEEYAACFTEDGMLQIESAAKGQACTAPAGPRSSPGRAAGESPARHGPDRPGAAHFVRHNLTTCKIELTGPDSGQGAHLLARHRPTSVPTIAASIPTSSARSATNG